MDGKHKRSIYKASKRRQRKSSVAIKSKPFNESLKAVTKEYCKESSICGLKHLVDENTPNLERIIWKITLIGALVCSVSLVWSTFERYYRAPLVTTQMPEGVPVSKIIFPAVGICTNNRISKRAATEFANKLLKEERNKKYSEADMLNLIRGLGHLYNLEPSSQTTVSSVLLHEALGEYDVNEVMRNLTPRCEDLLLKCAWNDVPTNCSNLFDFRLTMDGYCCTFNYLRESDSTFEEKKITTQILNMYNFGNKSSFDFDQGLKVLIRLNTSDDFYYNVPLQGAKLQFSDAYDFPDAPSGSFALQMINPGVQMTVNVAATFTEASRDIQHVAVKLRRCLFYDESSYLAFYTSSDCMLKCRMLFLLNNCGCTPFNMLKMENARTCDMRDVTCLRKYYVQSITNRPDIEPIAPELELDLAGGGLPCPMCFPTCSKTAYSYDFYNLKIYPEFLNKVSDADRDRWLRGANFTGTSIVHVKYAKDIADCYGQNVIMKWFDLFSNIGSTCGFVTGFSFVSVLEFVYFFSVKLIRDISIRRRRNKIVSSIEESGSAEVTVGRYRPIYWNELTGPTRFGFQVPPPTN